MNRNAIALLKMVSRYSVSSCSKDTARSILLKQAKRPLTDEEIGALGVYHGGFITACLKGDMIDAYFAGDEGNKRALQFGMTLLLNIWNEPLLAAEFEDSKEK